MASHEHKSARVAQWLADAQSLRADVDLAQKDHQRGYERDHRANEEHGDQAAERGLKKHAEKQRNDDKSDQQRGHDEHGNGVVHKPCPLGEMREVSGDLVCVPRARVTSRFLSTCSINDARESVRQHAEGGANACEQEDGCDRELNDLRNGGN